MDSLILGAIVFDWLESCIYMLCLQPNLQCVTTCTQRINDKGNNTTPLLRTSKYVQVNLDIFEL